MSGVHIRVRAGGEQYALPVERVREIAELGTISPVPGAPPEVLGVRNLRGQVLPVIDLAAALALDGGRPERLVVAEDGPREAGLAVDAVLDVGSVPDATERTESALLNGAALAGGELVGIVNVPALLETVVPAEVP